MEINELTLTLEIMLDVFNADCIDFWRSRVASLALKGTQVYHMSRNMTISRDGTMPSTQRGNPLGFMNIFDYQFYIDDDYIDSMKEALEKLMEELKPMLDSDQDGVVRAADVYYRAEESINVYNERIKFVNTAWNKSPFYDPDLITGKA